MVEEIFSERSDISLVPNSALKPTAYGVGLSCQLSISQAMRAFTPIFAILLSIWVVPCLATTPLMDSVDYDGETTTVIPQGQPWLDIPENDRTREIRLKERCSAIGAPRAEWRITEQRLWLVGLFKCGGAIKLESVYGGSGAPIFADWITSDLVTQRGRRLCSGNGITVRETAIVFRVDRGVVLSITRIDNKRHSAIPTVQDMRKILEPYGEQSKAEEFIANSDWPCLSPTTQRELRGAQEPIPSTGGTVGQYLRDHVDKLLK
ncbi:hypothetical protein [Variovorax rhizosphaerae]|uniref:Uncharacterized protein n=1 Tax=Variovorax rhizosphaerae TaxID=1836200 RepID=A0ABU8WWK1_9BURK